ncbi:MAG: sodium ion-translocating decarboxylase subunit beta [Blautia sp.]|nr:sodium ion-translocating decarboxylase subunit beta [Lachnoclostridium sp.]MCM1212690.1 sodium ion-translocating decarboxylase subunit beta [Blautia sp.]
MTKRARSISIIGGADGPTSIFIVGKGGKVKLTTRIRNYFYKIKRNRIKKRLTANPHTLEEVVELLKSEYGAEELSQQSIHYREQRKDLKAALIMRHRPELLGELMDLKKPEREDVEAIKAFLEQIRERSRRAEEIAEDVFPMDFHMYEMKWRESGTMRVGVETVWQMLDGSYSGDKKAMKQLRKMYKRIYLYYGVTAEDIENETERYKALMGVLCS